MERLLVFGECPWSPTSMGKVVRGLCRALGAMGYEVHVSCPAAGVTLASRCFESEGCRVHPYELELFFELVQELRPEAVVLYGTPYAPPLSELLASLPRRLGRGGRPLLVGYFVSESLVLPPRYALCAVNVHGFACPTRFVAETFVEAFERAGWERGAVEERVGRAVHGLDVEFYSSAAPEREVEPGLFTYGMFAKNHVRKSFPHLLWAYALLPDEVYERSLLLLLFNYVATSDVTHDVEALVEAVELLTGRRGLGERVRRLPPSMERVGLTEEEVAWAYAQMDVQVFMTEGEAFGLPVAEAALVGTPTVPTAHPALAELWGGAVPRDLWVPCSPYLTPEGLALCKPDPGAAAEIMARLYESESLRRSLLSALQSSARLLTEERMASELLELVDRLLGLEDLTLAELGP